MNIEVRLFATLRKDRGKILELSEDSGCTPADIIQKLDICQDDVAILLVNGRDGCLDQELQDGDILSIFPPVGGG